MDTTPHKEQETTSGNGPVETSLAGETTQTSSATHTIQPEVTHHPKRMVIIVIIIAVILGAVVYLQKGGGLLDGISFGGGVGSVNGDPITKSELEEQVVQLQNAAALQGFDLTDPEIVKNIESQALEILVNTKLLTSAAQNAGIVITETDIDEHLAMLTEQIGGEEVLTAQMEQLGMDEATLRENIKSELSVLQYLEANTTEAERTVTEEEITARYTELSESSPEGAPIPALEEVYDSLQNQLVTEKRMVLINRFVEELKENADISISE